MASFTLTPLFEGPVEPGDFVEFELTTDADFPTFTGVIFSLSYNADEISFEEVVFEPPFSDFPIPQSEPDGASGEITIENFQGGFFAFPVGTGVDGENTIATLTFEALAEVSAASLTLTPTFVFFGDPSNTIDDVTAPEPVSITVNLPPVAQDDAATTDEDTSVEIDVLDGDTDGGGPPSIQSFSQAENGTVTQTAGGLTYDPDDNFNGTDQFTYTIVDSEGATDTATVTVTVDAVNDDPIGNDDTAEVDKNDAVIISVLDNDTDVEVDAGGEGQDFAITEVGAADNGTVEITGGGTTVTYTPNTGYVGPDSFTYTVSDGAGGTDTATVDVTVKETNVFPIATDDAVTTSEDTPIAFDPTSNDTDDDGDDLTISSFTQGSFGAVELVDGELVYTPNENANGVDNFTYLVSDGNGGSDEGAVTVTVDAVNDLPVAGDDGETTDEDTPVTIDVLTNDSDVEGPVTLLDIASGPSNGSAEIVDGQIQYTPDSNFSGEDSFVYTVIDSNGAEATATVTVVVTPINDPPVGVDDPVTTDEDTQVAIAVLANDTDSDNDSLSIDSFGPAANGTVTQTGGTLVYTPNANFSGTDSFSYVVSDGNGGTDDAIVDVTVTEVPDQPNAVNDTASTDEDTPARISVLDNDTDGDGDQLSIVSVDAVTTGTQGTVEIDGNEIVFTPNADFAGETSFLYTVSDGNDGFDTATAVITVNPVNDPPEANDDSAATSPGVPVEIDILSNDSDVEGDQLTVILGDAANGSLSILEGIVTYTPDPDFSGTDSFTYTIDDGESSDTAIVNVAVSGVTFAPNTDGPYEPGEMVEIELATIADFPDFIAFAAALTYDADVLSYLGTEFNSAFSVIMATEPDSPAGETTINIQGGDIEPLGGEVIVATFQFEVIQKAETNVSIMGDLGTFFVNLDGETVFDGSVETTLILNSTPVLQDDDVTLEEDGSIELSAQMLQNDSDGDDDTLEIISVGPASNGTVSLLDGKVTYAADTDYSGADSFEYTVTDGVEEVTATVNLTITPVNDAPIISNDTFEFDVVERLGGVIVDVDAADVDDDDLTYSLAGEDQDLFSIVAETGEVSFSTAPLFDDAGDNLYEFDVIASDGILTDTQSFTVEVLKDTDEDTIADIVDNAVFVANKNQRDSNGDGFGNVIDGDFNGDFKINVFDLIFFAQSFSKTGLQDGVDAAADADFTGDGKVGIVDLVPFASLFGNTLTAEDSGLVSEIA